jgi:uncharacterized phage protein gp47/JayE
MAIQIKSFNQILGDMIRKIIAETPLNDLNTGSVLLTLLEAAAANDFENNTAILNVLELLNIDAVKNNDLDARAGDYGLERRSAIKASGLVTIKNTNITKRSTGLYVIKPAPIAGQTTIYVNNTTGWAATGNLYIGRGTQNFEGPIAYTAITTFPTYSAITLASALQKDHLSSDTVIDSQGEPDRIIAAGTIVKIPANNQNPEIQYVTLRDAILPSGEDSVSGVEVIAIVPGTRGNAGINTITDFDVAPFSGGAVTNTSAFSNGQDIETDVELRNRIKSYAITLARGTAAAITSAVIGVSDPDDSKQVASAVLTEPVKIGDPSIMYIDDGNGFQPSYAGQSVDILLNNAEGTEEFLQLANFPLPRPQVVNVDEGPFNIEPGSFLRVIVDGEEDTIEFSSSQFLNTAAATISEIIVAINDASVLFKARFAENSKAMLLYPVAHDAEIIQVSPQRESDNPTLYINSLLKFPTNEFSYISLYQNSTRLREKSRSAELTTATFASWNITTTGNIIIEVDGTPAQDRSFALSDFPGAASFASLSLEEWVEAFNNKFAGLTASATPSQTMVIISNKGGAESSISITGGTYLNKWFPTGELFSVGQSAEFELNRQTGNLRILTDIEPGDVISAGVEDAKGFSVSAKTISGTYNVSSDAAGRPAEMVVVADSEFCVQRALPLLIGGTITITNPSAATMRIMSNSLDSFAALLPGDFIYIARRTSGWLNNANTGLFKIKSKGSHTTASTDTFVDVDNVGVVPEASISIADSLDIKAFTTDGYPQIWRGAYTNNPPAEPISGIVESLNTDLLNVFATVFKSNSIKITSTTETGGSIAIPVSIGNLSVIFPETEIEQEGNPAHIANRVSDKALVGMFKRTAPVSTNVWLGRHTYSDIKGALTANAVPDPSPFSGTYSEVVESTGTLTPANTGFDDYLSFTKGNNRNQFRNVKALIAGDQVGTQQSTARTELDHITGNEFQLVRPVELSSEDSIVVVMDKDATTKTVDIKMARTGRVNTGSGMSSFVPTTTEFSANDYDNEPGIDFSNTTVWGTSINNTDFSDYAVWMRSRNWYAGGGVAAAQGKMIVRATQYGPNGDNLRFAIEYPTSINQDPTTTFLNTPSFSTLSYFFGSGPARPTALNAGDTITILGPYPTDATNFPNGSVSTGNYYDYTFSAGNFASVSVGDVLSIISGSGVSVGNRGQFRVAAKSGNTVRVFNPSASTSAPGAPEIDVFTTVADTAGSLNGKYFIIYDENASVAVWFDIDNQGTEEPFHGAERSIRIGSINTNDPDTTVAAAIAAGVNSDASFNASAVGNQLTITSVVDGNLPDATVGTSGFSVIITQGAGPLNELITNPSGVLLYPLVGADVASIVAVVNESQVIELVAVGNDALEIGKATKEEDYAYGGNSTALGYGHNPTNPATRGYIQLFDGVNWVKSFQNANPNFTLKRPYILNGVAPTVYSMDTVPNYGIADLGELFKLIPTSIKNVHHHLTQKALSQLPIVSNVRITSDRKNVQITSKELGSAGAIEVIGGSANKAQQYIFGESEVTSDVNGNGLLLKVPAFPDTFNTGDTIKIQNDIGVRRFSRLLTSDSINVTSSSGSVFEYNYNPKAINVNAATTFAITDVSASYGRPSGFVWRWTHGGGATLAQVRAGDLLMAFGPSLSYAQGNKTRLAGDGNIAGLPIIFVNDVSNYFDVVNAYGVAMAATAVGSGNTVQICPTPIIKWNLSHAARVVITSISRSGSTVSVSVSGQHFLNTGDSVNVMDSLNLADGDYSPVTVTSPTQFTFTSAGSAFTELNSGASILETGLSPTRYRIEKLGFNGMVRISRFDGASPAFAHNGVAVDDYVVIGGNTFSSNNNGRFRVLAVDNDSIIIINTEATNELNTTVPFNNNSFQPTWTANTNTITGVAGTFKNVLVGDWVKKPEDADTLYRQVLALTPSTPSLATTVTLGGNYGGSTAIAEGISYDMLNDYDTGIVLQNIEDIQIFEGDSVVAGDTISIQNIINSNWFSVQNIGTFDITEVGTDSTTLKPFVRIVNAAGLVEANRLISIDTAGFYITESLANKYYSMRKVVHTAIDDLNEERRSIYVTPHNRAYKFSNANTTSITHMGKLGYNTDVTTGVDGYLYYTGLLRRVQRIVDGYEPDQENFPGRRAVGGAIEILPPLIRRILISIDVTTDEGVNLGDIGNNIKSVIINYIQTLGVGQDVILSEIIAAIMNIKGVGAVTFTNPVPSTERIVIANNEKATISPEDIGIA